MNSMVFNFPGGFLKDNWATVVATVGNAHVNKDITCPTGKKWWVFAGSMSHDDSVAHVMNMVLYNENDKLICILSAGDTGGAGARPIIHFPMGVASTVTEQGADGLSGFPMKAGWYVRFSAATNMTDASVAWEYNLVVLEVDAP